MSIAYLRNKIHLQRYGRLLVVLANVDDPAFTGFFNEGHKRIDLVIVTTDNASDEVEQLRVNFLMNALKLGLELELEEGKLPEHKNLIFIKVHAPDAIVEEFGLYFNERKFFKDSHIEFIHQSVNILGMTHEREIIKIVRDHYPGPVNYSTLERSMIVYKILLQLRFGDHENHFGINKLIKRNILLDAFALHDGPYFMNWHQKTLQYINARQALFYNWVGVSNILKMQPIHLIREYLGERVAFYFGYYQYFMIMLIVLSVLGTVTIAANFSGEKPEYSDDMIKIACGLISDNKYDGYTTCNECRNLTLCPFLPFREYCKELKYIQTIDKQRNTDYALYAAILGFCFISLWKRKEKYLLWMWEVNKKFIKSLTRPEYELSTKYFIHKKQSGVSLEKQTIFVFIWRFFCYSFELAVYILMVYGFLMFAIYMCYFKHWYTLFINKDNLKNWKRNEHLYIAIAALIYASVAFAFKIVGLTLSYVFSAFERNKTYGLYDRSLAIKFYAYCIAGTFAFPLCLSVRGTIFYTHPTYFSHYYIMGGYPILNNGLGSALDDIFVTMAVLVVVDQVFFKIPTFLYWKITDYTQVNVVDNTIPCWEREYKLPNLTDFFFHYSYNIIAIQLALAIASCAFPLTPLLILLMDLSDIRHKAREILLCHRRPLLMNATGPGIWHNLNYFTVHFASLFNAAVIVLQSRYFLSNHVVKMWYDDRDIPNTSHIHKFKKFKAYDSQLPEAMRKFQSNYGKAIENCIPVGRWMDRGGKNLEEPCIRWWSSELCYQESLILSEAILLTISLMVHFLLSSNFNDIKQTIKNENRIKERFNIHQGFSK